ncbi:MAG: hypothetical protein Q8K98_02200 [Bacteroidota bacterium]|nr:hypothetical protein [Bacteroidota bacterium]
MVTTLINAQHWFVNYSAVIRIHPLIPMIVIPITVPASATSQR